MKAHEMKTSGSFGLRACAAIAALGFAFTASADIPASAYVQSGLVAQFDGIENAGSGTHNGAATTWTDLTGNGYDATLVNPYEGCWSEKSLMLKDGLYAKFTATFGSVFTIDIGCNCPPSKAKSNFNGIFGCSDDVYSIYKNGSSLSFKQRNTGTRPAIPNYNGSSVVAIIEDTQISIGYPGQTRYTSTGSKVATTGEKNWSIGGCFNTTYLNGDIYAVRIYDRALTAEEIAWNAKLDTIRFGADAGNYRWDAGTRKIECRVKVSCDVTGDGRVTIDGEDMGEGFDRWCEIGTGHVLMAIPGDGQEFYHWEGDVEGMSLDEKMRPVLAISGERPCDLSYRAVFRRAGLGVHLIPTDFATLAEALASEQVMDRDVIRFIEGVHCDTTARTDQTVDSIALKVFATVDKPVVIEGMGTDKTVLDLGGDGTLLIDNPEAILRNLVITNFQNKTATASTPLFLNQGTATNVVITGAQPSSGYKDNNYIAVVEKGAKMCGCDVCDVTNTAWANSAIIWVKGGTLCHSKVRRCSNYNPKVKMSVKDSVKPLLEDCELTDNLNNSVLYGGFVARNTLIARNRSSQVVNADGSFVLDGCRILDNVITSGDGPIVYFGGYSYAYMTNCLVAGNQTYTGPIFKARECQDVYLGNCTVAHNRQLYGETATFNFVTGSTGNPSRAILTNTIFFDNPDGLGNERTFGFPAEDGKFLKSISHCLYPEAAADDPDGNVAGDPRFVDAAAGDFMLNKGSLCIDAGIDLAGLTDDLEGRERPLDGDGDGVAVTDIGCYEKPVPTEAIEIALDVTVDADCDPGRATLKATVTGLRVTGLAFEYLAIRTLGGEVTTNAVESLESTYTFTGLGVGLWSFACRVRNGAFPPDEAVDETKVSVAVKPATTYVSLAGGDEWPYDTEAKAARNLQDAVEASGRAVKVLAGMYSDFTHFTDEATGRECLCAVHGAISVEGAGEGATVVDCGGLGGFVLDNAGAALSGLTLTNFVARAESGAALYANPGTVSHVTFQGGTALVRGSDVIAFEEFAVGDHVTVRGLSHSVSGVPTVRLYGATLRDSTVEDCRFPSCDDWWVAADGSARGTRSRIESCLFRNNYSKFAKLLGATRADVTGSTFVGNGGLYRRSANKHSLVALHAATMANCVLTENSCGSAVEFYNYWNSSAGDRSAITNCLVASNMVGYAAVDVNQALSTGWNEVINCTVANNVAIPVYGNSTVRAWAGGIAWGETDSYASLLRIVNTVVWGNVITNGTGGLMKSDMPIQNALGTRTLELRHNCFSEAGDWASADKQTVEGNIAKDPLMRSARRGKFSLRPGSPCVDAGDNLGWTADDVDLAGATRVYNKVIDMGCYEKGPTPGLLIQVK